jgi:protocatechuate 3,4-dioxygenase beta subunit
LGVSMLVEMLNQMPSDAATDPTVFGPFYVPGAPELAMGSSIAREGNDGEALVFSGTVRDAAGQALEHARLDVWQVAPNGLYDVQDPASPPLSYRGVFETGPDGHFEILTNRRSRGPDAGSVGSSRLAACTHPLHGQPSGVQNADNARF